MIEIVNVHDYSGGLEKAAAYFHQAWSGISKTFYLDAIVHSSRPGLPLPRFYLLLKDARPIGCYGLVTNDFISRHDLYPWFAALFIEESERGQQLGSLLLEHAGKEAAKVGFAEIYLTTDHEGYYEKYGWNQIEDGCERDGTPARIYSKSTGQS